MLHLKCTVLTYVSGLTINVVLVVTSVRVVASAGVEVAAQVAMVSMGFLKLEALLQLYHHVSHGRLLCRCHCCALESNVCDLPHAVDIMVSMHARVNNSFNVATC
jgi:hypothetical protein